MAQDSSGPKAATMQLARLAELLEEGGVGYWLEAGVLLGFLREGRILEWDNDIDLGTWAHSADEIRSLSDVLAEEGYRMFVDQYKGATVRVNLVPSTKGRLKGGWPVAVNVWRRHRGKAWRAALYQGRNEKATEDGRDTRQDRHKVLSSLQRMVPKGLLSALRPRVADYASWPTTWVRSLGTWRVPARFFESPSRLGDAASLNVPDEVSAIKRIPVPHPTDEYLAFHYGDWETPVPDWDWSRDDPGFIRKPPEALGMSVQ